MKTEILLNSKKSKSSANVENNLSINVESDSRLLPIESIEAKLNEYQQYEKEKANSNKYRLTFIINPICSNILFNNVSEIIYKEGSDDCIVFGEKAQENKITNKKIEEYFKYKGNEIITHNEYSNETNTYKKITKLEELTRYDLIRDTSFSHSELGGITYHCGYDIFNNHLLREKEYAVINKLSLVNENKSGFNTIDDYMRDYNGNNVKEYMNNFRDNNVKPTVGKLLNVVMKDAHLYLSDTIYNFEETINENLTEKDGWYGFINKTNLDIENYDFQGKSLKLNKCLNDNKPCEFIDMYPDRSLFSFIPKVNKYRNFRLEKNWDYCLTYPKKNDYSISLIENQEFHVNGLECEIVNIEDFFDEDSFYLMLKTKIRNNFNINSITDIVLIYDTTVLRLPRYEKIIMMGRNGTEKEYYFTIYKEQVLDYMKNIGVDDKKIANVEIRVRKVSDGNICRYYLRKFGKIGNFNNVISKVAFSENIYSDKIAQILYNDDIDLTNFKDNLGRQVSEIYLTIVKRNMGRILWDEKRYNDSNIEFSHCFGPVSAGIDMGFDSNGKYYNDYNIHRINNLPASVDLEEFKNAFKSFPTIERDFIVETYSDLNKLYVEENIEKNIEVKKELYDDNNNITKIGLYQIIKTERGTFSLGKVSSEYRKQIEFSKTLKDDITIENDEFDGDIIEFSPNTLTERVLENVLYRFNTVQREKLDSDYQNIWKDIILYDDYDVEGNNFRVIREKYNAIYSTENNKIVKVKETIANIAPEGYFYKPHYRILLKLYNSKIFEGQHTIMEIEEAVKESVDGRINITLKTKENYYPEIGRKIWLYDKTNNEKITATIINIIDKKTFKHFVIVLDGVYEIKEDIINNYNFFKPNVEKPDNSYELEDGTGRYIWQEFMTDAESNNTELKDYTFTNGAHYINKNINFFLRRQDPIGKFDLNNVATGNALLSNLVVSGNDVDYDNVEYNNIDEENRLC